MLKLDIHTHCRLRNAPTSTGYLRKQGFTRWVAHKLAKGKSRSIAFDDLEMLCQVFKCTPNDLFEWIPATKQEDTPGNALAVLKKDVNVEVRIKSLSYSQLKEVAKIVGEKK